MGRSQRAGLATANKVPGPGNYDMGSKVGEGPHYVIGQKLGSSLVASASKVPGPGTYQPMYNDGAPRYSIRHKTKVGTSLEIKPDGKHEKISFSVDFAPGPGAYNPVKKQANENGGQKWGHDKRSSMENTNAKSVPGPNVYDLNTSRTMLKSAPAFGFGTSRRPQSHNARQWVPGPGAYDVKGKVGTESTGKSLGMRIKQASTSQYFNPGPGAYHASPENVLKKAPTWRIGSSTRDDREKAILRQKMPPPGSHNPIFDSVAYKSAVWSFGSSTRPPLNNVRNVPGAGTYDLKSKAIEGPAFVMGLKLDKLSAIGASSNSKVPAPNTYDQSKYATVKPHAPAFSMKSRYALQKSMAVPGPGTYDSKTPEKKRPASFVFGSSPQRENTKTQKSPGPQAYHIPSSIANLPRYTGARPEQFAYI